VGIVLAGGGSKRLATLSEVPRGGKAWLRFQGRTFLERVVAAVAGEVDRTIVVAAPEQPLPAIAGPLIVRDSTPDGGPLAGIRDGLRAARDGGLVPALAFVVSCDLPLLVPEAVRLLLDRAADTEALWTLPIVHGHRQVLASALRFEMLPRIEAWLAAGRRDLRGLCDLIGRQEPRSVCEVPAAEVAAALAAVDPALASFQDVDTPDDLARLHAQ